MTAQTDVTVIDAAAADTAQRAAFAAQRRFRQKIRAILLGTIPFAVILLVWLINDWNFCFGWFGGNQVCTQMFDQFEIPSLASVFESIFSMMSRCTGLGAVLAMEKSCELTTHILSSVGRVFLAAVIGMPVGIALGVLAGMNRTISRLLEPIAIFANSISGIAWIPLAIVWFGVGWVTTLFIILNTVVWLMFFNTMLGVRSVARVYEQCVLTMGGNRWDVIRDVYLPGAMPSVITGMRMSVGFGWRALIAAEMIGGDSGLGFMIALAAAQFQAPRVFLGVILIALIWMVTDRYLLVPLERWTIERWGLVWKPI